MGSRAETGAANEDVQERKRLLEDEVAWRQPGHGEPFVEKG